MNHTADRTTREILGRSLITAATWLDDLRRRLSFWFADWWQSGFGYVGHAIDASRPMLTSRLSHVRDSLHYANMMSWVSGIDWAYKQVPQKSRETIHQSRGLIVPEKQPVAEGYQDLHPDVPLVPPEQFRFPYTPEEVPRLPAPPPVPPEKPRWPGPFADGPDEIRFPKIEEAAERLLERDVITREQFDAADEQARQQAFTVAGDMEEGTIEKIRDTLAEDVQEGTSLDGFRERLDENLGKSPIGGSHLETVYRTNVQGSFRDGRETLMQDPVVDRMFPYQKYAPIHDDRVRPEHEALGSLGLNGTGIYRRDDPFWNYFTPPWSWNCRCAVSPMTLRAAARAGVREAKEWLDSGRPPEQPEWRLNDIPFPPVPGFGSRGLVSV